MQIELSLVRSPLSEALSSEIYLAVVVGSERVSVTTEQTFA